jgi:hypothetical protein
MAARRCCPSLITNFADIGTISVPTRSAGPPSVSNGSKCTAALIDAVSAENT